MFVITLVLKNETSLYKLLFRMKWKMLCSIDYYTLIGFDLLRL